MSEDERRASPPGGEDASWIESLGLTDEGEKLIRHALDMADAVIRQETAPEGDAGAGGESGADLVDRSRAAPLVREGPSVPIDARTEPYVQPEPIVRAVNRRSLLSERRSEELRPVSLDRRGSARTPRPPLPDPGT